MRDRVPVPSVNRYNRHSDRSGHQPCHRVLGLQLTSSFYCFLFAKVLIIPHFFRTFAAIFRIVYDERQNYIGIVEHIHDALVKYIAS